MSANVLHNELYRLVTFTDFPESSPACPSRLARLGFAFTKECDKVVCFRCGIAIDGWQKDDNPAMRHRRSSPSCPLLTGSDTLNVPLAPLQIDFDRNIRPGTLSSFTRGNAPRSRDATDSAVEDMRVNNLPEFLMLCKSAVTRATKRNALNVSEMTPVDLSNPNYDQLRSESVRLTTFANWPPGAPVSPEDLAKNGFFYTGQNDRVQCAFCRGFLRDWAVGDKPADEHRKHFSDCPFVKGAAVGNVARNDDCDGTYTPTARRMPPTQLESRACNNSVVEAQQTFAHLSFDPSHPPKHPEYSRPEARRETFLAPGVVVPNGQTIDMLVEAGFYHVGPHDNVKCFYCEVGLKNFQPTDDPWLEHAKWFPRCSYVRQMKDAAFIQRAQMERTTFIPEHHEQRMNNEALREPSLSSLDATNVSLAERSSLTVTQSAASVAPGQLNADSEGRPAPPNRTSAPSRPTGRKNAKTHARDADVEAASEVAADVAADNENNGSDNDDAEALLLLEENRQLKEARTCKVCMDKEVNVVFLPCGHLVCCDVCSPALRNCAVCRSLIRGTVKIFLS